METLLRGFSSVFFLSGLQGPAAVNRRTGALYLGPDFFKLPAAQRQFVLLHEQGHKELNTRDELKADAFAFHLFVKKGLPLSLAVASLTRNLSPNSSAHKLRAASILARAKDWDKAVNRNQNKLLTMQERLNNQNMHLEENREALLKAIREGDIGDARTHLNEVLMHFPPEEHTERMARYEALFAERLAMDNSNFEGQPATDIEGLDDADVYHYCGCGCQSEREAYEEIADAAFAGFSDEDLDELDAFICLSKSCRERKMIKTKSKAEARVIKANAKQTKADAKLELAKQGIKTGFGEDLKGALGGLGNLATKAAGAVAAIKTGGMVGGGDDGSSPSPVPAMPAPPEEPKKPKIWLWVGIGSGALLLIGLVAFIMLRNK